MNLAMITARGGSKRIPRKNIRNFCGKPIIHYSIEAASASACFDEVMVSTEDAEIAQIAARHGASIPFMRSQETASDTSTTAAVILEVLQQYQKQGKHFDFVCCIYPTAPFITGALLNRAYARLVENPAIHSVFPVARFSYPIQRALKMSEGKLSFREPEHELTMSQNLPPFFHDVGQFYWINVAHFLKNPRLVGDFSVGVELPLWQMQDIDHEDDWVLAEMKYQYIKEKKSSLAVA